MTSGPATSGDAVRVAGDPATSLADLTQIAQTDDPAIIAALLTNPAVTKGILLPLVHDHGTVVAQVVTADATGPRTLTERILRIVADASDDPAVIGEIITHPNASQADHDAANPHTHPVLLTQIAALPRKSLHLVIAGHPNATPDVLRALTITKYPTLGRAVAANPATPADALQDLVSEHGAAVWPAVLARVDCPPETIDVILDMGATKHLILVLTAGWHPHASDTTRTACAVTAQSFLSEPDRTAIVNDIAPNIDDPGTPTVDRAFRLADHMCRGNLDAARTLLATSTPHQQTVITVAVHYLTSSGCASQCTVQALVTADLLDPADRAPILLHLADLTSPDVVTGYADHPDPHVRATATIALAETLT